MKRRFLITAFVIGLALLVINAVRDLDRVETGENVASVPWLPAVARNISFFRSYSFTAFEFDITEAAFLEWAKDKGYAVKPVQQPQCILRYHHADPNQRGPGKPAPEASREQFNAWEAAFEAHNQAVQKTIH